MLGTQDWLSGGERELIGCCIHFAQICKDLGEEHDLGAWNPGILVSGPGPPCAFQNIDSSEFSCLLASLQCSI